MTDAETSAAIEALAYRVRNRDAAMRDGGDYADPEVFAGEFLTAMRGHGWRPTEAKAMPMWKRPAGGGSQPPADLLAGLRTDLEAKAAARRDPDEAA